MQKLLDDNILMYSTHNEGKSVVAERFLRTLKGKAHKKLELINSKSYLGCLNKLVDKYNNAYHHSIGTKPVHTNFSVLPKKCWIGS